MASAGFHTKQEEKFIDFDRVFKVNSTVAITGVLTSTGKAVRWCRRNRTWRSDWERN